MKNIKLEFNIATTRHLNMHVHCHNCHNTIEMIRVGLLFINLQRINLIKNNKQRYK